jgi:hypothetical protein
VAEAWSGSGVGSRRRRAVVCFHGITSAGEGSVDMQVAAERKRRRCGELGFEGD